MEQAKYTYRVTVRREAGQGVRLEAIEVKAPTAEEAQGLAQDIALERWGERVWVSEWERLETGRQAS